MTTFEKLLDRIFGSPSLVAIFCVSCAVGGLAFEGSLFRYWGMYQEQQRLIHEIEATRSKTRSIQRQISKAKDPGFIERQARDRLDLVEKSDLVFVFSDDVGSDIE